MPNDKEKCDIVVSGRITLSEKHKMEEHNFKIREAIQDKIALMEDPHKLLRYRRNILKNELRTMKYEIEAKQRELDEINEELGFQQDIETNYSLDVFDGGNNIISRYKSKRGSSKYSINDYLSSADGERVVEHQVLMYGGGNKAEFKKLLLDYVISQCKQ